MVPADRARLEAMYADFEPRRAAQGLPPAPDRLSDWLDHIIATGQHIVATTATGSIVGHVMLVPLEPGIVELASFVHQSARGHGLGSELARAAVQLARDRDCRRVWLSVEPSNRAAVRSYARAGFTRVPGSAWAPELEMAIDLTASPTASPPTATARLTK